MNDLSRTLMPRLTRRILATGACALIVSLSAVHADQNWDGDNAVGNFSFGNNWFGDFVGGLGTFGFSNGSLHFSFRNNSSQASIFYDFGGWAQTNDIIWDATFPAGLAFNGNGQGLDFNQRLENLSAFTQTLGSSMNLSGAKNGATQIELNPVNGNLIVSGNVFNDNSRPYVVFGNNDKTLTLNSTLGVGGTPANVSFSLQQDSNVIVNAPQGFGNNTFVNAGEIRFNNTSGSGAGTGNVLVNSGGTIGGTGSFTGQAIINSGGTLDPGNSIGTLATGSLSLTGATSTFSLEIDLGVLGADLLNVTGGISLGGGTLDLSLLNAPIPPIPAQTFLVASNDLSDAVLGTFGAITGLPPGYDVFVDYAFSGTDALGRIGDGNDIALTIVPEPATAVFGLAVSLLAMGRRPRTRRQGPRA